MRRTVVKKDLVKYDYPAKVFFSSWISRSNVTDIEFIEIYQPPDVTFKIGNIFNKVELECRRNFKNLVWNAEEYITVPKKFDKVTNTDNFYHVVLDCDEIDARCVTRFMRIDLKDILKSEVRGKWVWSHEQQCNVWEKFYFVPVKYCQKVEFKKFKFTFNLENFLIMQEKFKKKTYNNIA